MSSAEAVPAKVEEPAVAPDTQQQQTTTSSSVSENKNNNVAQLIERLELLESQNAALHEQVESQKKNEMHAHMKEYLSEKVMGVVQGSLSCLDKAANDVVPADEEGATEEEEKQAQQQNENEEGAANEQEQLPAKKKVLQALTEALRAECDKSTTLANKVQELEETQILALHDENQALREKNAEHERTIVKLQAAEDVKVARLGDEVKTVTEENEKLHERLSEVNTAANQTKSDVMDLVGKMRTNMQNDIQNLDRVAELEKQLKSLVEVQEVKASKMEAKHLAKIATLGDELSEQQLVLEENKKQFDVDMMEMKQEKAALETKLEQEKKQREEEVAGLKKEVDELQQQLKNHEEHSDGDDEQQFGRRSSAFASGSKRKRGATTGGGADDGYDIPEARQQMTTFFVQGREEIRKLKMALEEANAKTEEFNKANEKLVELNNSRGKLVASLTELTEELQKSQEDCRSLRANQCGLEAENGLLAQQLGSLVEGEMGEEDIKKCCEVVRQCAVQSAQKAVSTHYDEAAVEKMKKQAQQTQQEISQLSRKRDKLKEVIATREDRVSQLNHYIATKELSGAAPVRNNAAGAGPQPTATSWIAGGQQQQAANNMILQQPVSLTAAMKNVLCDVAIDEDELARKQKRLELLADVKVSRDKVAASEAVCQQLKTKVEDKEKSAEELRAKVVELEAVHAKELETLSAKNAEVTRDRDALTQKLEGAQQLAKRHSDSLFSAQSLSCQLLEQETKHITTIISQTEELSKLREQLEQQRMAADVESKLLESVSTSSAFESILSTLKHHLNAVQLHVEWRLRGPKQAETEAFVQLAQSVDEYKEACETLKDTFATATAEQLEKMLQASAEERTQWEQKIAQKIKIADDMRKAADAKQQKTSKFWDEAVVKALGNTTSAAAAKAAAQPTAAPAATTSAALSTISASLKMLTEMGSKIGRQQSTASTSSAMVGSPKLGNPAATTTSAPPANNNNNSTSPVPAMEEEPTTGGSMTSFPTGGLMDGADE